MGCCEGCGQVILVIINLLFSLIGIVLLVFACLVRFGSDFLDTYLQDAYTAFQKALSEATKGSDVDISNFDIGDILGDATIAFIVIGVFFFVLGIFGCFGALCKVKFLLIVYTIVLMTIFIAEVVFVILLFAIKSEIDGWISKPLVKKLENDYTGTHGKDTFTITMNFVMHEFKCCGIESYTEFNHTVKWNKTNEKVPEICCKNTTDTFCARNPNSNNSYIDEGCYKAVNDWLTDHSESLIGVGTGVAVVQLILIIFATVICCQRQREDAEKDSVSDDIAIYPYRESPEAPGHNNYFYTGTPQGSQNDVRYQEYNAGYTEARYGDRNYPEPYRGRTDYYTGPPDGYGHGGPYRR